MRYLSILQSICCGSMLSLAAFPVQGQTEKYLPIVITTPNYADTLLPNPSNSPGINNKDAAVSSDVQACLENSFTPVYDRFNVVSNRTLLAELNRYYSMDETQYNNERKKHGLEAFLPDQGTFAYNSGKEAIMAITKKYTNSENVTFSEAEYLSIGQSFVNVEHTRAINERVQTCLEIVSMLPRLTVDAYDDNKVIAYLILPHERYPLKWTRLASVSSTNLQFIPPCKSDTCSRAGVGQKVQYGSSYALHFRRKDKKKGTISVGLEHHPAVLRQEFPAAGGTTTCVPDWCITDTADNPYEMKAVVRVDWPNSKFKVTAPNGEAQEIPWNRRNPVEAIIPISEPSDSLYIERVHSSYNDRKIRRHAEPQVLSDPRTKAQHIRLMFWANKEPTKLTYVIYYRKRCLKCTKSSDAIELASDK